VARNICQALPCASTICNPPPSAHLTASAILLTSARNAGRLTDAGSASRFDLLISSSMRSNHFHNSGCDASNSGGTGLKWRKLNRKQI